MADGGERLMQVDTREGRLWRNEWSATRDGTWSNRKGVGMSGVEGSRGVEVMRRLPATYSLALRLRDAGLPNDLIAECVAVEPEAVAALLVVAEAKLAAIRDGAEPPRHGAWHARGAPRGARGGASSADCQTDS